jgi:hypothetical protein
MATPTKTLNPLPFGDLEPRRFEDLIRQLAYDFRTWRALEATGRAGSDDSFDVRGWEIVGEAPEPEDDEDAEDLPEVALQDRIWLIQCKREKEIGPKKLVKYVNDIPDEEVRDIYGVIVAAACDLSKSARDEFREACRARGIQECYLWSRGELEDMLFQPKNDGILFAYFGISLTIRKRTLSSRIRSRLATKRKLVRAMGKGNYLQKPTLFLHPDDQYYPYKCDAMDALGLVPWRVLTVNEHHAHGILVAVRKHFAYLHEDRSSWDAANAFNDGFDAINDPWRTEEEKQEYFVKRHEIELLMQDWQHHHKATIMVFGLLRFEDIIEVDQDGDVEFDGPIVYTEMENGRPPFSGTFVRFRSHQGYVIENDRMTDTDPPIEIDIEDPANKRIKVFPDALRILF